jgi:hypothetical protein
LAGCYGDVDVIGAALADRGFEIRRRIEADATRDAILAGYRELIDDTRAGDAALVYYSGHGGRFGNPDRKLGQPDWVQYILPTDIDDTSADDFRGLFAEDLTLLQYRLTKKTPNVTTILDCCHSARMSRDPRVLPKAFTGGWPAAAVAKRYVAVADAMTKARADAGDDAWFDSNPLAVRLVACGPSESAYEIDDSSLGGIHGSLTEALVVLLREVGSAPCTWSLLADRIRRFVALRELPQRPEAEGPTSRLLFDVAERESTGVLPVDVEDGSAFLESATFFGLAADDELLLLPAGEVPGHADPVGTGRVVEVVGARARLEVTLSAGVAALARGTEAHPARVSLGRQRVTIEGGDAAARAAVESALGGLKHVQVSEGSPRVATIALSDAGMSLLDPLGERMWSDALTVDAGGLARLQRGLTVMARAAHLRALTSGNGEAALETPVSFLWWTDALEGGRDRELIGEVLHPGDRVFFEVRNQAPAGGPSVFVNVFDVGLSSKITLMNTSEPSGIELPAGKSYVFGKNPVSGAPGLQLTWPKMLPAGGQRPETIIAIFSDRPQALAHLQTDGVRSAVFGQRSDLERLVDSVVTATREFDMTAPAEAAEPVHYAVVRAEFRVEPDPAFAIENMPDPSVRLTRPQSTTVLPRAVAVRLLDVVVLKSQALFNTDVRLDALFLTRGDAADPASAKTEWTERFPKIDDGARLPLDRLVVYHGPVRDFLDIALWISKDPNGRPSLDQLVADASGDQHLQEAVGRLVGLAGVGGAATGVALGAVAVVVRTAGRLLRSAVGDSEGLYRTTLLPLDGFGPGRRPKEGLIAAGEFAFAYEVVSID